MKFVKKENIDWKTQFKEWCIITFGTLLVSVGVYFFKFPNNFSTGGVAGISVILGHYFPNQSPSDYVGIINIGLLIIGFIVFGKNFALRTCYCSLLMSGLLKLFEVLIPMNAPFTTQPFMELIFAVALSAAGSAILFNYDASSGGTDIVAMIVKKFSSMDIGKALTCSDFIIAIMACFAFGMETGLYSLMGLFMKSFMVDMFLDNIKTSKCFQIITTHKAEIESFITTVMHRSATEIHGEGAFTHEGRDIMLVVVSRREAIVLRKYIRKIDPHAFLIITNSGEIIGKGFRGTD